MVQLAIKQLSDRQFLGKLLLLTLFYFASGKLGLAIPYAGSHITLFWLPTGIAVAALFRFGFACWPGVFLGALLVNLSIGSSLPLAGGIAVGNTLAPILTAWLLRRVEFHPAFDRREDIASLCAVAALGMLISALNGSVMLSLAGLVSLDTFLPALFSWWSGDFVGVMLGGAMLLSITRDSLKLIQQRYFEFLVLAVLACLTGWIVFYNNSGSEVRPLAFFTFPLVIWASLRFGVTGAMVTTTLLSLIAVWATSVGRGQFYPHGMFLLWAYINILIVSVLMITALLAERKRAEDLATLLLQSVSQGVWGLDAEGRVTFVNSAAVSMLGYTPQELIGKYMHDVVHHSFPDGAPYPRKSCPMHATLNDCKPRTALDEVLWRKDGSKFPVEYNSYPAYANGSLAGAVVVCQDISERKAAEKTLRESESRFRTIVQSSPLPILITRLSDGSMIEVNDAFLRMFGYTRAELIGHTSLDFNMWRHPEQREQMLKLFNETGYVLNFNFEYRHKFGSTGFACAHAQRISINGESCLLGICEDITAQMQTEQRLQEQHARLNGLIESAMDAIVSTDEKQNITLFNHAAERVFGYRAADIIGQPLDVLIPPRYHASHRQHVEEYGRSGKTTRTLDMPGVASGLRANGEEFPVEASISMVEVAGKKVYTAILRDISKRIQTRAILKQNEERLRQAVSIADIGFCDHDHLTGNLYWSPEMRTIFGLDAQEPVTMQSFIESIYPADCEQAVMMFKRGHDPVGDGHCAFAHRIVRRDGAVRWLAVQFQTGFSGDDASRHPVRTVGAVRDITQRKQSEQGLQLAASVYHASHEGIVLTDENNLIIDINPAVTTLTGYTLEEVRGKNPRIFQSGKHDPSFYQQMWQTIRREGYWQGEIWDKRKDGELHAKWLSISVIRNEDGSVFRYVGQFSDITEKKRKDELIWTQANFDALTNLPNRRLLTDRIQQAMSSGTRSGRHSALVSLDLDQFKQLNDTLGHSTGDKLLVEVARRLQGCVREEDTVARMGGDEFLVVLNELSIDQKEAAIQSEQIAEKIRSELCRPYQLGETDYHSSSSLGIVLFSGHSQSQEELLAHVDAAMYQAKDKGRNTLCFYDASMQAALEKRSQLENALRLALTRNELHLHYQLQVDSSGRAIGAEALLRWMHPQLGMVPPAQFIPVAEESGLILPIGHWVLETACAQLARWQTDARLCHLSIAVNVSARQFREPTFVTQVKEVLKQSGIRPEVLKLELTESLVLANVDDCIRKMQELQTLGIKFSMDDFGTGYSSLSYLSRLPIDQLKIDQSFVRNIATDQHDAAIVQTIISMALSLGLDVIAEGVETEAQREFLELRGCQAYQGYLYAKPVSIDELETQLANRFVSG